MNSRLILSLVALLAGFNTASFSKDGAPSEVSGSTTTQSGEAHEGHGHAHPGPASVALLSDGTIKKVDKASGRLTISHGPLENLDMPSMTMVFGVKDPAFLEVQSGQKIRFYADKVDGRFTVLRMEAQH